MLKTYIVKTTNALIKAAVIKNVNKSVNFGDGTFYTATPALEIEYQTLKNLSDNIWAVVCNENGPCFIYTDACFKEQFELYSKKHEVYNRINSVLKHVSLEGMLSDMEIVVSKPIELDENIHNLYLQIKCNGVCNVTGELQKWSGRKWQLSEHMTDQEIVQTAFKAVLTALEHEARELFKYKDVSVLDPHYDLEKLVELRKQSDSVVQREKHIPEGHSSTNEVARNKNGSIHLRLGKTETIPKIGETWLVEMLITQPKKYPGYSKGEKLTVKVIGNKKPSHVVINDKMVHINHVKFLQKVCMDKNNLTDIEKGIEAFNKLLINSDFKKSDDKLYEVFAINWREYEKGWGNRTDGHTLYKTATDAYNHREEFVIKHDHKNPPSTYTYPGTPFATKVNKEILYKLYAAEEKFIWGDPKSHAKKM